MHVRVLVTGVGGFVGPHLVRELTSRGHEVHGAGREACENALLAGGCSRVLELANGEAVAGLMQSTRPETIVHLAAQSNPGISWEIPRETYESNVVATIELVRAAGRLARKPRFVFVSSSDIYGVPEEKDLPLAETAPARPMNPYAVSKLAAEQCARLYGARVGVEVVLLRPFSHTGPGQSTNFAVPAFAEQIARIEAGRGEELGHGELHASRDFTDVRDVVRAYRLVVEAERPGPLYNVCSGRSIVIRDILDMLCSLATVPIRTHQVESRTRHEKPSRICGSAEALQSDIGWQPQITFEQTLRDVLDEQRSLIRQSESVP